MRRSPPRRSPGWGRWAAAGAAVAAVLLVATAATAPTVMAQQDMPRPPVPPGPPTRGFAVVLIGAGLDYSVPDVAARLARDGEGDVIGWDGEFRDARPFTRSGGADRAVALAPFLIAPVRVVPARAATWNEAFAFLARTPARVVVVALPGAVPDVAREAATRMQRLPATLFLIAAPPATDPAGAAARSALTGPNVVVVDALRPAATTGAGRAPATVADLLVAPPQSLREAPGADDAPPRDAIEAAVLAAGALACLDLSTATSAAEVRQRLLAAARRLDTALPPALEPCDAATRRR